MKKKILIFALILFALFVFYLVYPKYYFIQHPTLGALMYRCNKITGRIELNPVPETKQKNIFQDLVK